MVFHVIDDQPVICEYVASVLDSLGHEAMTFQSPVDYLNYLKRDDYLKPEAVFTDITMPSLSGSEMVRKILSVYPEQMFVIISGKPDIEKEHEGSQHIFLNKPFDVNQLKAVVGRLNRHPRRELPI